MKLSLKEVAAKGSPVLLSGTFDLSEHLSEHKDFTSLGTVQAELAARLAYGLTTVEGTLTLSFETKCSRCLQPIRETLAVPFREVFAERQEMIPKEELDDVHLVTEDLIQLEPYVEEAVWLALPYAPVCSADCKGLCPVCGKNRNTEPCGCSTEKIDPRLAGLADFFKQ